MAYDPSQPLFDQALSMAWNNRYESPVEADQESAQEVRDRMHKLLETAPGTFTALCAAEGLDAIRYADDIRSDEQTESRQ